MASVLQVLFHIGAFRQLIYSFKDPKQAPLSLQNLFIELQTSSSVVSLNEFICTLGSFDDISHMQQDAHEFFITLIDRLESDLGAPFKEALSHLFHIVVHKTITQGTTVNEIDETYLSIPIIVEGFNNLNESLESNFFGKQKLDDYNGKEAYQKCSFRSFPHVLVLQLARYKYCASTQTVVEITDPFSCPKQIELEGISYELFAVISHSGTPTFGHYVSLIRVGLGNQWYMFNDSSVSKVSEAEVMHSFDNESTMFSFGFGKPHAYMVFYVRKESVNIITATDFIPVYLAPYRSNKLFSNFIFYDEIKGLKLHHNKTPFEWENQDDKIIEILNRIRPDFTVSKSSFSAWVRMPGESQFVGPIDLSEKASAHVIKGHPSEFFILPSSFDKGPVFVSSNKSPFEYLDVYTIDNIPQEEENMFIWQGRNIKKLTFGVPQGAVIQKKSISRVNLCFGTTRISMPYDATFSDVQARIALENGVPPEKILLTYNSSIMKPHKFPIISSFPSTSLSYQILNDNATASSISLFSSLRIIFVSDHYIQEQKNPIFLSKGFTCEDLINEIPHIFPIINITDKIRFQCSVGSKTSITKVLPSKYRIKTPVVRVDIVRYEIPRDKWRLVSLIENNSPMSIEVRCTSDRNSDQYEGVSRIVSLKKNISARTVVNKVMRLNRLSSEKPVKVFLFASEKTKLRYDFNIDDNVYEALAIFAKKLTLPKQRACFGIMLDDPLLSSTNEKTIPRSLSDIMISHWNSNQ
ncbi:Clan CA, family C19, ubiquitin hydrolase-like cysteine peptidase [Histomonas meleagridis]|uniref:Clan CA, family C19, ubiquitin hydrolase-like cysteine peptidase n=1 Tax=Histomonas meleagridis TaxID=135588 RepID=UPI00355A377D|nr:Clan CA, family C19, ubiquitin hydrolase-like cysteine peptidase [Histomonas meleagridis]KAH0806995.1 Clan CA, family C19, ubiquitin hydrolase-like cysteine peptidase [Histomonas meleagridis]